MHRWLEVPAAVVIVPAKPLSAPGLVGLFGAWVLSGCTQDFFLCVRLVAASNL